MWILFESDILIIGPFLKNKLELGGISKFTQVLH